MTPIALKTWLIDSVLPIWWQHGIDWDGGGFCELVNHDLLSVERARRARLIARQIYSFAVSQKLGWTGKYEVAVEHGLDFLQSHLISESGDVLSAVTSSGEVVRRGPDLYDDAFVLLALATVIDLRGGDKEIEALGRHIAERICAERRTHEGAFQDKDNAFLANPQMHLFEAFLAWTCAVPDKDGFWRSLATDLIGTVRRRMIQPELQAIVEVFDSNWVPIPDENGLLIEPGHQFEWGWLLARWSVIIDEIQPFREALSLAKTAEMYGLNKQGIVIESVNGDLKPRDQTARLWAQAERAKFWHAIHHHPFAETKCKAGSLIKRDAALAAMATFWADTRDGLWREVRFIDGSFAKEPVRASSLYHIICAAITVNEPWVEKGFKHADH